MPILAQHGRESLYLPPYRPFFTKDTECQEPLNGGYTTNNINIDKKTTTIKSLIKWPHNNVISIEFKTNEKNNITKVTITIYKNREYEKRYTISLNEEGKVQSITKKSEENDNNKDYKDEIKKLLYGDKINKHLTENIEYELDEEQRKVWNEIQSFLAWPILEGTDNEVKKKINNHGICDSLKDCCTKFCCGR